MPEPVPTRISKDVDAKILALARDYYHKLKQGSNNESQPEMKVLVSGTLDDGQPTSLLVKVRPNPINCRLTMGWKIVAEDRTWEIAQWELERSKLL